MSDLPGKTQIFVIFFVSTLLKIILIITDNKVSHLSVEIMVVWKNKRLTWGYLKQRKSRALKQTNTCDSVEIRGTCTQCKGFVLGQLMSFLLTKEPTISLKSVSHHAVGQD